MYSWLAGINVTVVLGEIIEPIKIVFRGDDRQPIGAPWAATGTTSYIMALLFLSASLKHL
jgi:hypothetical protein